MARHTIDALLELMARLRDPQAGCPWDREQSFATIAPYTIEEAYEVADAVGRNDMGDLKEELGDLLFQVVFHARMAEEAGQFTFADVVDTLVEKMRRRHPHVFGTAEIAGAEAQTRAWEAHKAKERAGKGGDSILSGVALALPALMRGEKLQKRAARVGFEWPDVQGALDKVREELAEVEAEIAGADREALADEAGDLLFACVNVARMLGVDAENALCGTNEKFERRFRYIESRLAESGRTPQEAGLEAMDELWNEAKRQEKQN